MGLGEQKVEVDGLTDTIARVLTEASPPFSLVRHRRWEKDLFRHWPTKSPMSIRKSWFVRRSHRTG